MAGKLEEAEKLMKKANKLWAPSLLDLRLKPDWEGAAPLYEKAALAFKARRAASRPLCRWRQTPAHAPCAVRHTRSAHQRSAWGRDLRMQAACAARRRGPDLSPLLLWGRADILQQAGELDKSRGAYERAAMAQDRLGSGWHAGKLLEAAAAASKDLGDWPKAADFARQAGAAYAQAGRPTAGAAQRLPHASGTVATPARRARPHACVQNSARGTSPLSARTPPSPARTTAPSPARRRRRDRARCETAGGCEPI